MKYLTVLAALLLTGAAAADEVRLANGGRLSGMAREEGDRVVVQMAAGTVTLAKADVVSVIPGRTILHEYEERLERAETSGNPSALFELATWAGDQGLFRYVPPLLRRVVASEPDHAEAHRRLGHVLHRGRWMAKEEYLRSLGNVEFLGAWMKPEEREAVLRAEAARRESMSAASLRRKNELLAQRRPEGVSYTLGLPRYTPSRGSRVWTSGWYSTFGSAWYMTPYAHGVRGVVPTLVPHLGRPGGHGGSVQGRPNAGGVRGHR